MDSIQLNLVKNQFSKFQLKLDSLNKDIKTLQMASLPEQQVYQQIKQLFHLRKLLYKEKHYQLALLLSDEQKTKYNDLKSLHSQLIVHHGQRSQRCKACENSGKIEKRNITF